MSGSQACRGSAHGPDEKEMCHLKAEKNKLNHSGCLLSQILFLFIIWQVMKYREICIKYNQYLKKLYFHM